MVVGHREHTVSENNRHGGNRRAENVPAFLWDFNIAVIGICRNCRQENNILERGVMQKMGKWIVLVSGHPEYQNAGKAVSKSGRQHEVDGGVTHLVREPLGANHADLPTTKFQDENGRRRVIHDGKGDRAVQYTGRNRSMWSRKIAH